MNMNFEEPDGLGWVLLVIAFGVILIILVAVNLSSSEREMKMALEAGCSQVQHPGDRGQVIWGNCSKGLPSGSMPSKIIMEAK